MDCYSGFAKTYDLFMDGVPYDNWCEYLCALLKEEGITSGIIADLGCGTGQMTRRLARAGFDMIGVDLSSEMLEEARAQVAEEEALSSRILWLHQDMRELELFGTTAAMVSVCDSLNYILEPEELCEVFRLVNNYLDPGGVFLFDLNTPYEYREILGDHTFAETREEAAFIWENEYDSHSRRNTYDLTLFMKQGNTYERMEEVHLQRAYSLEEIKSLLEQAGMKFQAAYETGTWQAPGEKTTRMTIVAKEQWQEGKEYR